MGGCQLQSGGATEMFMVVRAGPRTSGRQSMSSCTPCACTWAARMMPLAAWAMVRIARASRVSSCAAMLSMSLAARSRSTCSASDPSSSPSLRWCACPPLSLYCHCVLFIAMLNDCWGQLYMTLAVQLHIVRCVRLEHCRVLHMLQQSCQQA